MTDNIKSLIITDRESARRVLTFLQGVSLEKELEDAVTSERLEPDAEGNAALTSTQLKAQKDWDRKDRICRGLIQQHLDPDDADSVANMAAKCAIEHIQERYINDRQQGLLSSCTSTIQTTRIYENDKWDKALEKILSVTNAIGQLNRMKADPVGIIGSALTVNLILGILPESFSTLKQAYLEKDPEDPTYNVNQLKTTIQAMYDSRPKGGYKAQQNRATQSNSSQQNSRSGSPAPQKDVPECGECGKRHRGTCNASSAVKTYYAAKVKAERSEKRLAAKLAKLKPASAPAKSRPSSSSSSVESIERANYSEPPCKKLRCFRVVLTRPSNSTKLDSGAEAHFTSDLSHLENPQLLEHPIKISQLAGVPGVDACVTHIGTLKMYCPATRRSVTFSNVYYGKAVTDCLVSVGVLDVQGYKVIIYNGQVEVFDETGKRLCVGKRENGLYTMDLQLSKDVTRVPKKVYASSNEAMRWHERLGHLGWTSLAALSKLSNDIPEIRLDSMPACSACLRGKQTRSTVPKFTLKITSAPLDLIHTDIAGPYRTSLGGANYVITFTDDFSRYTVSYFLSQKSEAFGVFKDYRAFAEKQTGRSIRKVRMDNGGEYTSQKFEDYLMSCGIEAEYSPPYTPELNGVAERTNRTVNDKVRPMLNHAGLPEEFWAEATRTAIALKNRTPTKALDKHTTPHQAFLNVIPDLSKYKVFGCLVSTITNEDRRKLDPRSHDCINLGYTGNGKYRLYDVEKGAIKVVGFQDCRFFEDKFLPHEEIAKISVLSTDIALNTERLETIQPKTSGPINQTTAQKRKRRKGSRKELHAYKVALELANTVASNAATSRSNPLELFGDTSPDVPNSYKAARNSPELAEWERAERSELEKMRKLNVYSLVDLPKGKKAIPCKWVYTRKENRAEQHKARLVARGDRQTKDNYSETYAPVAKMTSFRLLHAIAAQEENKEVYQTDVDTAFLHSSLEEEVYMQQPEGHDDGSGRVWLLHKAIYGLKQSGRSWYKTLHSSMTHLGWVRADADHGVYVHKETHSILTIWVDDLFCVATPHHWKRHFDELGKLFPLKDLGISTKCLGMEVYRRNGTIVISQESYATSLLSDFDMDSCSTRQTPLDPSTKLSKDDCPLPNTSEFLECSKFPYRKAIGKLMYLMLGTRPDLAYAVSQLSSYASNPGRKHIEALKHVLRYLKGSLSVCLTYTTGTSRKLVAYSDANWGGDESARSTTGYVYMLAGGPVSWNSKLQHTVALSTTEAEYMASAETIKEGLWLKAVYNDIRPNEQGDSLLLKMDNNGAIHLTKNAQYHGRTKHISIRHHFIRDCVDSGTIVPEYCQTSEMLADCMTKPVKKDILYKNMAGMNLFRFDPSTAS